MYLILPNNNNISNAACNKALSDSEKEDGAVCSETQGLISSGPASRIPTQYTKAF